MDQIVIILELLLLCVGIFFFIGSLTPIKCLISELPEGVLKVRWNLLQNLIFLFIVGYGALGIHIGLMQEPVSYLLMIVTFLLFLGGVFAYFVGQLALQTTNDVKDLAILQHESITDALTGLRNRRYFDQRLCEEVALSTRYKLPLTLMFLDVDYFKKINDTYGHQIGDDVLTNLSKLVQEVVRDSDIVARYGGEEIAIITPNTGKQEAALLAERLRKTIETTTVSVIDTTKEVVQVTISIGLCALSPVILDQEALLEETDQALYLAKKYGRNRVVSSNW